MKIYKYTPHIELFIKNSALKLTPIIQLNDPFEAKISSDLIDDFEKEFNKTIFKDLKEQLDEMKKSLRDNGKYKGVISFSKSTDNLVMLSHYGNNHKGGILEFNITDIDKGYNNKNSFIKSSSSLKYNWGEVDYIESRLKNLPKDMNKYFSVDSAFKKHYSWAYEDEIRFLSDFRKADYFVIPKQEIKSFYKEKYGNELREEKGTKQALIDFFKEDILKCSDSGDDIVLVLKNYENNSPQSMSKYYNLSMFFKNGIICHPMLKIKPESLTGIYLGCNYQNSKHLLEYLSNFSNLNGNLVKAELGQSEYNLNYKKVSEIYS